MAIVGHRYQWFTLCETKHLRTLLNHTNSHSSYPRPDIRTFIYEWAIYVYALRRFMRFAFASISKNAVTGEIYARLARHRQYIYICVGVKVKDIFLPRDGVNARSTRSQTQCLRLLVCAMLCLLNIMIYHLLGLWGIFQSPIYTYMCGVQYLRSLNVQYCSQTTWVLLCWNVCK